MELRRLSQSRLEAAAAELGACLEPGDVVLLQGPMGAGKTTLTRALARGLGVRRPERVRSPTYNLCLVHDGPRPLAHIDLFRLAEDDPEASVGSAAFEALGLSALAEGGAADQVLVIEWSELWADPPVDCLRIELRLEPDDFIHRTVVVTAGGGRSQARLDAWRRSIAAPDP